MCVTVQYIEVTFWCFSSWCAPRVDTLLETCSWLSRPRYSQLTVYICSFCRYVWAVSPCLSYCGGSWGMICYLVFFPFKFSWVLDMFPYFVLSDRPFDAWYSSALLLQRWWSICIVSPFSPTYSCDLKETFVHQISSCFISSSSIPMIIPLNFLNVLPCRGLVKQSAIISSVGQYWVSSYPLSTRSLTKNTSRQCV